MVMRGKEERILFGIPWEDLIFFLMFGIHVLRYAEGERGREGLLVCVFTHIWPFDTPILKGTISKAAATASSERTDSREGWWFSGSSLWCCCSVCWRCWCTWRWCWWCGWWRRCPASPWGVLPTFLTNCWARKSRRVIRNGKEGIGAR